MAGVMDDLDNDIKRTIDDAVDEAELLPFRYENVPSKVRQRCHAYPKPEILVKGSNMTIYEIGFIMLGWLGTAVLFYSMGVDTGYKEGRRAMRKFYEQRDKVRA